MKPHLSFDALFALWLIAIVCLGVGGFLGLTAYLDGGRSFGDVDRGTTPPARDYTASGVWLVFGLLMLFTIACLS